MPLHPQDASAALCPPAFTASLCTELQLIASCILPPVWTALLSQMLHMLLFIPPAVFDSLLFSPASFSGSLLQVVPLLFLFPCRCPLYPFSWHILFSCVILSTYKASPLPCTFWLLLDSCILPWPVFWFVICISSYLLNISSWVTQGYSKYSMIKSKSFCLTLQTPLHWRKSSFQSFTLNGLRSLPPVHHCICPF